MMKKLVAMAIASVLVIGMAFFTACIPGKKLKVTLYLNGTLGDKSFYDSAGRGLEKAIDELGIEGETIEGGYDQTRWEPDLEQVSRGDADIIIVGTWQMKEILEKIAPRHPLKKYFIFDTAVDYTKPGLHNVYSILYKQNEGSFLAGALAALVTASDMARVNKDKTVGFLGGIDESTINDFKAGYIQGVHHIDPEIQVLVSYAGAFDNPALGKELALEQYGQGADIAFNVAGQTGLGLLDAAAEKQEYAIGVDSDQYLLLKDSDPEKASWIVTSMMKHIDTSLFRGIQLHREGTLAYGTAESLGIKEGGVGIADNENYRKLISPERRDTIDGLAQKIVSGEIVVDSALMDSGSNM